VGDAFFIACLTMSLLKTPLIGLKADSFRHPLDLEATRTLKQIPGLDMMVRNWLGPMAEQVFYVENIASSILVGEKQLPDLHQLLLDACNILDIEPPQLYIRQHPAPNAYTFAMRGKQPFVVLHTSLIEILTPEEIQAVIAHELGHLKCDHSVYLTPVNLLILAAAILPNVGAFLAQAIQAQLLEWVRCAEFTCDRAALLATQNPKVVMSVLMKLAGGSPTLAPQLNLDAFVSQARAYDDISKTELGEMVKASRTAQLTHPVPVLRAREIDIWSSSQEYQTLLHTHGLKSTHETISKGGWRNW
jgi:Zn-dependent protease with chaperone function